MYEECLRIFHKFHYLVRFSDRVYELQMEVFTALLEIKIVKHQLNVKFLSENELIELFLILMSEVKRCVSQGQVKVDKFCNWYVPVQSSEDHGEEAF